jgi:hypothetical protein
MTQHHKRDLEKTLSNSMDDTGVSASHVKIWKEDVGFVPVKIFQIKTTNQERSQSEFTS